MGEDELQRVLSVRFMYTTLKVLDIPLHFMFAKFCFTILPLLSQLTKDF